MKKLCFLLFIFVLVIPTVTAQDGDSNLLDMLATMPDTSEIRESLISYVDFRAMEFARPGIPTPESWDEFIALDGWAIDGLYIAALNGIRLSPNFLALLFSGGEYWEETVGFDFFMIDKVITFGSPPGTADVLMGEFDFSAIEFALSAQGYTSEPRDNFILWCGTKGCKSGFQTDIQNANFGNPFGGDLGRQEPILSIDNLIVSSVSLSSLLLIQDAIANDYDSLADHPTYVAATAGINPDNILIQSVFVHPKLILWEERHFAIDHDASELDIATLESVALPSYELMMIADTATETEQVVSIILVFDTIDDAEIAVELIPIRLNNMRSSLNRQLYRNLLLRLEVNDIKADVIVDEETGKVLAVLEFHAPVVDNTRDEVFGRLRTSGSVYRLFFDMLSQRNYEWLATSTIEQ